MAKLLQPFALQIVECQGKLEEKLSDVDRLQTQALLTKLEDKYLSGLRIRVEDCFAETSQQGNISQKAAAMLPAPPAELLPIKYTIPAGPFEAALLAAQVGA